MHVKLGLAALLLALTLDAAEAAEPKRVLFLHTYSHAATPWDAAMSVLRSELSKSSPEGPAFFDATIESGRPRFEEDNAAEVVASLRARFAGLRLDLVIPVGGPAARFYHRHRDALFPDVPMLVFGVEERVGRAIELRNGDAAVGVSMAIPPMVRTLKALLPETRTVHIVLGDSPLERYWAAQVREEFAPFEGTLRFAWLNTMPFPRIKERVAALKDGDVVLHILMLVDAAGTPLDHEQALRELRVVSAVPVFGFFENEFGRGIVGGPLTSHVALGHRAADSAMRIMAGTTRALPEAVYLPQGQPKFDARELARFSIPEERLPAGSVVEFRPPSLWREHRTTMIAIVAVVLIQAMLILALIRQGRRLQRAEQERITMNGRLFTAHEDERRRLARELHDDVTQRLARLAIDAAHLEKPAAPGQRTLHGELARLGEDVHALSYRLHPSILDDLGLAEALKAECEQVARREPLNVEVDVNGVPDRLSSDAALCVFRVAQEALRNIARHARAAVARVSLRERDGGVVLTVSDDGVGFDSTQARTRPSLGLAGMRERVRLIGGRLDVDSVPGAGTRVVAWVPLAGLA